MGSPRIPETYQGLDVGRDGPHVAVVLGRCGRELLEVDREPAHADATAEVRTFLMLVVQKVNRGVWSAVGEEGPRSSRPT